MTAGRVHSCGKCQLGRDLTSRGRQAFGRRRSLNKQRFLETTRLAVRDKQQFQTSPNDLIELVHSNCGYCGVGVREVPHHAIAIVSWSTYTIENLISACPMCVAMRGKFNHVDFLDKVDSIHRTNLAAIPS